MRRSHQKHDVKRKAERACMWLARKAFLEARDAAVNMQVGMDFTSAFSRRSDGKRRIGRCPLRRAVSREIQNVRRRLQCATSVSKLEWQSWQGVCEELCTAIGAGVQNVDAMNARAAAAGREAQCISVKQPYASLMALGLKTWEARRTRVLTLGERYWIASTREEVNLQEVTERCQAIQIDLRDRAVLQRAGCLRIGSENVGQIFPSNRVLGRVTVTGCVPWSGFYKEKNLSVSGLYTVAYTLGVCEALPWQCMKGFRFRASNTVYELGGAHAVRGLLRGTHGVAECMGVLGEEEENSAEAGA